MTTAPDGNSRIARECDVQVVHAGHGGAYSSVVAA